MELRGAVAAVTGAGSGLGAALSARLAREGCAVAAIDLRPERAARTAEALRAGGAEAEPFGFDVGARAEVAAGFRAIGERFGRVDLLVNCAGRSMLVAFADMTDEDIDWVLGPNLMGVVWCTRAALPWMRPGGRVVNVTSISGAVPTPGEAFYSGAKAAVVSLSESLEAELAGRGIRHTVVLPGEMSTALFDEHDSWQRRPDWQRRMEVPPERVADAIVRGVRRDRFRVVAPRYMRGTLLLGRLFPGPFRRGVARYWRRLEPRLRDGSGRPAER